MQRRRSDCLTDYSCYVQEKGEFIKIDINVYGNIVGVAST